MQRVSVWDAVTSRCGSRTRTSHLTGGCRVVNRSGRTTGMIRISLLTTVAIVAFACSSAVPPLQPEDAQLASQRLYREAVATHALGRLREARELLDRAIELWPGNIAARILRNTSEDRRYVIEHAPSASVQVYLDEAREVWLRGRQQEAKAIMTEALRSFDTLSVHEVVFDFNENQIPFSEVLRSLELDGGQWSCPSWCLPEYYLTGDKRILIWDNHGQLVRLRFGRYGFAATTIELPLGASIIQSRRLVIAPLPHAPLTPNTVSGRITLADNATDSSGIAVWLGDYFGVHRGFSKTTETERDGTFAIANIPNGRFELYFSQRDYVSYSLELDAHDGDLRCLIDTRRHFDYPGINPCNLHEIGLQLHPVHTVMIRWILQDDPAVNDFPDLGTEQEVELSSAAPDDWRRGSWDCCDSSFKFGNAEIDPPEPDLVVFTDTDGSRHFGQPLYPFIAAVDEDFEVLNEVPESLDFRSQTEVREGQTYVLKTFPDRDSEVVFFVKLKVTAIQ
jgi:tetratricopeptide (TPR) repeat protein